MTVKTSFPDQRARLVETGAEVFHAQGFVATGVREVAKKAGLPPGSFTNHFRSKERLGIEVLDHYAQQLDDMMSHTLGDTSRQPIDRFMAYVDLVEQMMRERSWKVGCLIPDLAGEASVHSELIRVRLAEIMQRHAAYFSGACSELYDQQTAEDIGANIQAAWHGTLLRMKVERSEKPVASFRRFIRFVLNGR